MSGASGRPPHFQFRIRWMMGAVAVAALGLALPRVVVEAAATLGAIPAALIVAAAGIAPRGRRRLATVWVAALHPLAILAWLMIARSTWCRRTLLPVDNSPALSWTLEIPYLDVLAANLVILPALFLGSVVTWMAQQRGRTVRVCAVPLVGVLIVPLTWLVSWIVLAWDPFELRAWVWD